MGVGLMDNYLWRCNSSWRSRIQEIWTTNTTVKIKLDSVRCRKVTEDHQGELLDQRHKINNGMGSSAESSQSG